MLEGLFDRAGFLGPAFVVALSFRVPAALPQSYRATDRKLFYKFVRRPSAEE